MFLFLHWVKRLTPTTKGGGVCNLEIGRYKKKMRRKGNASRRRRKKKEVKKEK